jgi:hypothetical protein
MPIENIVTQVATLQRQITGIKQAHDRPPGSINVFPCFVNFIGPADINYSPSRRETRHTIKMQLYVTKQVTAEAERLLRPFIDRVLDKFDDNVQLNDTCAYSMITHYEPGVLTYGGHQYLGISFDLVAVEHESRVFQS